MTHSDMVSTEKSLSGASQAEWWEGLADGLPCYSEAMEAYLSKGTTGMLEIVAGRDPFASTPSIFHSKRPMKRKFYFEDGWAVSDFPEHFRNKPGVVEVVE